MRRPAKAPWTVAVSACQQAKAETHLHTTGGHVEVGSEALAEGRVGLCVCAVDLLEHLELCARGAAAVLDLVGLVGEEGAHVDVRGVDAGRDERGDAGVRGGRGRVRVERGGVVRVGVRGERVRVGPSGAVAVAVGVLGERVGMRGVGDAVESGVGVAGELG